jgi:hypothetical protein
MTILLLTLFIFYCHSIQIWNSHSENIWTVHWPTIKISKSTLQIVCTSPPNGAALILTSRFCLCGKHKFLNTGPSIIVCSNSHCIPRSRGKIRYYQFLLLDVVRNQCPCFLASRPIFNNKVLEWTTPTRPCLQEQGDWCRVYQQKIILYRHSGSCGHWNIRSFISNRNCKRGRQYSYSSLASQCSVYNETLLRITLTFCIILFSLHLSKIFNCQICFNPLYLFSSCFLTWVKN